MIYLPSNDTYNKCYVVQSEGVIRAYNVVPSNNTSYGYRDYYINSDYIYKDGEGSWSNYSTLPVCLDNSVITNDFYYRTDIADILVMFTILSIFIFYIPFKIFMRLFRRFN